MKVVCVVGKKKPIKYHQLLTTINYIKSCFEAKQCHLNRVGANATLTPPSSALNTQSCVQRFGSVIFLTDPGPDLDPTRKPKADPDLDSGDKGKR